MGLDIKGAIIIFDESHNIEDVCMECASMDVELSALVEAHAALSSAIRWSDQPELYRPLQVPVGGAGRERIGLRAEAKQRGAGWRGAYAKEKKG